MAKGDKGSAAGGTWEVKNDIIVTTDNIGTHAQDAQMIQDICDQLNAAGKNATPGAINPSAPYFASRSHSNITIFAIVGGVCWGTAIDYRHQLSKEMGPKGNNICWGYLTDYPGVCCVDDIRNLKRYAHDWHYGDIATDEERKMGSAEIIETYGGWVAGPDTNSLATAFLTGKGSGGGGTSASIVEGYTLSNKGKTPQFWTSDYFDPYYEVKFTNFEITDEYPRVKTATFESVENIDLTSGRVAVLITGDCNDFGGIIIKKDYDSKNKIFKYQCQGFMDRIMANPIYVVANGSKTVHRLIQETLNDCGLPDINLLPEDDYDTAITDETREKMASDSKLSETSEIFTSKEDFKTSKDNNSSSTSTTQSGGGDEKDNTIKTVTQTLSSTEDNKIRNPFKRKPTGIYDCETFGDFIRTLIFDYGVNVDFYGDINGIPHFDILDLETWAKTGWYITPDRGFDENFTRTFDITNIITQVGIKNISAVNGVGELYTSEELLGVNLENFVGRMGTIEDNPSANTTTNANKQTVDQLNNVYQDSSGRQYNKTDVINTNGQPSCKNCIKKNGGLQPVQKTYEKSWVNKCPGCDTKNKLKNDTSVANDYKTVCTNCNLEFCQYCGYERKTGKYQLTELWLTSEKSTDTTKKEDDNK